MKFEFGITRVQGIAHRYGTPVNNVCAYNGLENAFRWQCFNGTPMLFLLPCS